MIKIKTHKKIIIVVCIFLALSATTAFALVSLGHQDNGVGLAVPNTSSVKRQNNNTKKSATNNDVEKKSDGENKQENNDGNEGRNNQNNDENSEEHKESEESRNNNDSNSNYEEPKRDVITTKDVESGESIPFNTTTKNETNLKRGQVKVDREGVEGWRKIVTRVTYKNDEMISSEEIYNEVEREPVNQINLIGTSDYNLNNSYVQLYPKASVYRDGNSAPASMILVDDKFYMDFWRDPVTWSRIAPAKAISVSGGSFSYGGVTYGYEPGAVDDGYALTNGFCNEYGLACGRW